MSDGGGPSQQTITQSNIPDWLRPQVETVLGAATQQMFTTQPGPGGTLQITGTQPYTPYSTDPSAYVAGFSPLQQQAFADAANLRMPTQYGVASNMAQEAGLGGIRAAEQAGMYGGAGYQAGLAGQAMGTQAAQDAARQAALAQQAAYGYGGQGAQAGALGQQLGIQGGEYYGGLGRQYGALGAGYGAEAAGLGGTAQQYGRTAADIGQQALAAQQTGADVGALARGYSAQQAGLGGQAAGLADLARQYGAEATGLGGTAQQYGRTAADIGSLALRAQGMGEDVAGQARQYAAQQAGAGERYAAGATSPEAARAYMSPYMQNVVEAQQRAAQRQADIASQAQKAQFARAGALGGGRQAVASAQAAAELARQQGDIQAQGLQQAFQQAQQAQQFGAGLGLQGLAGAQQGLGTALSGGQLGLSGIGQAMAGQQAGMQGVGQALAAQQAGLAGLGQAGQLYGQGIQGLSAAQQGLGNILQGGQLGLSGIGQAMAGQQAGLAGLGQAGQLYGLGMQGAGMGLQGAGVGLQGLQQQLAGTAQGMQGAQAGLQGVGQAINAGQLGLQGAGVGLQGAQAGMQGAGMGLQGAQGALSGYGLLGQQAGTLGSLGAQQLAAQQGILGLQSQFGTQQQQQQQNIINQAISNFAMAQETPMQRLNAFNALLRGYAIPGQTATTYQAGPSLGSQLGGLGMGAYGMSQLMGGRAKGGVIKDEEPKRMATGGIASINRKVLLSPDSVSEEQIRKGVQNGVISDLIGVPILAQKAQTAQQMRGAQQAQQAQQAARQSIKDQLLAAQAQGIPSLPSNLPTQMAGGGIVAFAEGGKPKAPANPSAVYQELISGYPALLRNIEDFAPVTMSDEDRRKAITDYMGTLQENLGESPSDMLKSKMEEFEQEGKDAKRQALGLAALRAGATMMSTPGGFGRALGAGVASATPAYEQAVLAERAHKRAVANMQINLADAERKERMGLRRDALAAVSQAQRDKAEANRADLAERRAKADLAARMAATVKPEAPRAADRPSAVQQLIDAQLRYAKNPTRENKLELDAIEKAVVTAKDYGPARAAAVEDELTRRINATVTQGMENFSYTPQGRQHDKLLRQASREPDQAKAAALAAQAQAIRTEFENMLRSTASKDIAKRSGVAAPPPAPGPVGGPGVPIIPPSGAPGAPPLRPTPGRTYDFQTIGVKPESSF